MEPKLKEELIAMLLHVLILGGLIAALCCTGCAHNGLVDPAHYGTRYMRHDWAKAVSDGSMECRELLGIGPKPGCRFDRKTNDCTCLWTEVVVDEYGMRDALRTVRFNACAVLHSMPDWRADQLFSTIPSYELAATIEPLEK